MYENPVPSMRDFGIYVKVVFVLEWIYQKGQTINE